MNITPVTQQNAATNIYFIFILLQHLLFLFYMCEQLKVVA